MASNVTWSDNETDQRVTRSITLPIYLAAFIFGLIGNTLVIYVIARFAILPGITLGRLSDNVSLIATFSSC